MNTRGIIRHTLTTVTILLSSQAYCADDSISRAWESRSKEAADNLKSSSLDACDIAVEKAFQNATRKHGNGQTIYELNIQISNQIMKAGYSYKNNVLNDFMLINLPSRWMAHQAPKSQNFSVIVLDSNCAFDLCINNPFGASSCK